MRRLALGKIPIKILRETMLRMTGAESDAVVLPPGPGLDFGVVKLDERYLVVSSDPITGVREGIGRYAMTVTSNDVATSGNRPQFAESVVLLPEGSTTAELEVIASEIHRTAAGLGVSILGGHTEVTPGLKNPIVAMTVFSYVRSFVAASGARPGDSLLMTKTAGIEGTAAIASSARRLGLPIGKGVISRGKHFESRLSIVEESVRAAETGVVHAMHDCTEGGVLGAAYEMSLASGMGFVMSESHVPVAPETVEICRVSSIDPLKLIGSGALLMAVEKGEEGHVAGALRSLCRVTKIGEFGGEHRVLVSKGGHRRRLTGAPEDELWRVVGGSPLFERTGNRGRGSLPSSR